MNDEQIEGMIEQVTYQTRSYTPLVAIGSAIMRLSFEKSRIDKPEVVADMDAQIKALERAIVALEAARNLKVALKEFMAQDHY